MAGPLPGVHGEQEVALAHVPLGETPDVAQRPPESTFLVFNNLHVFCHCGFCWSALYTQQTACLSVLGQGSLLLVLHENCSIVLSVKRVFFLTQIEGLRTEGGGPYAVQILKPPKAYCDL